MCYEHALYRAHHRVGVIARAGERGSGARNAIVQSTNPASALNTFL